MFNSLRPHGLQHTTLPCASLSPRVGSSSCPLRWWCYLTISSSAALFFCLQTFPASGFSGGSAGKESACNAGNLGLIPGMWRSPGVSSNSCPWSLWCYLTISSSAARFSSRLQSFPASRSFPVSQLFASGGQSIGVSASASVLPMNTQDWSPLGWTGWISLLFKGLSRVFSSTAFQKHQFFDAQPYLRSNSQIHIWLLEKLV